MEALRLKVSALSIVDLDRAIILTLVEQLEVEALSVIARSAWIVMIGAIAME